MKIVALFVVLGFFLCAVANAADLKNKSLALGQSPAHTDNQFIKCVVQAGLTSAFSDSRQLLALAYVSPVGTEMVPEVVGVTFLDQEKTGGRAIHKILLKSTDADKKWQIFQGSSGEISYFSTAVAPTAQLVDKVGNVVLSALDISSCQ